MWFVVCACVHSYIKLKLWLVCKWYYYIVLLHCRLWHHLISYIAFCFATYVFVYAMQSIYSCIQQNKNNNTKYFVLYNYRCQQYTNKQYNKTKKINFVYITYLCNKIKKYSNYFVTANIDTISIIIFNVAVIHIYILIH